MWAETRALAYVASGPYLCSILYSSNPLNPGTTVVTTVVASGIRTYTQLTLKFQLIFHLQNLTLLRILDLIHNSSFALLRGEVEFKMNSALAFITFLRAEAKQAEARAKALRETACAIEANGNRKVGGAWIVCSRGAGVNVLRLSLLQERMLLSRAHILRMYCTFQRDVNESAMMKREKIARGAFLPTPYT